MTAVDLNADLGEGFGVWTLGDDDAMLDAVQAVLSTAPKHMPSVLMAGATWFLTGDLTSQENLGTLSAFMMVGIYIVALMF